MKPIPSTLETRRREVIQMCANGVASPDPGWHQSVVPQLRAVVDLGPDPTAEQIIAAQHGVERYSGLSAVETCDACGQDVERVVTVGDGAGYGNSPATLCRACLVEALAALDAAP